MAARKRKTTRKPVRKSGRKTAKRSSGATARTVATGMKVASAVLDESANFVDSMAGGSGRSRKRR